MNEMTPDVGQYLEGQGDLADEDRREGSAVRNFSDPDSAQSESSGDRKSVV